MNKRNKRLLSAALLGLLVFAGGCESGRGREGDQLIVAQNGEPVTLDPHRTNDARSAVVINQIMERLIRQDEDGALHPMLSTGWRQIDELTYEFDIREGVYFHNGEPLRASDVAFSLKRAASSPTSAPILGIINEAAVEVVDDFTVRVGTYEPFIPLLSHLAHTSGNIMSQVAVEAYGDAFGQNPVGTGSFKFEGWQQGDRVELVRFEDYWGTPSGTERLTVRNIPEAANRLIELETGMVDIALEIAPSDVAALEANNDLNLIREANLRSHYIGFNVTQTPLNDVRVRQAINYAIDTDLIISSILEGVGIRANGPMSNDIWGAYPNLRPYDFNLERSLELLAEAGFANGFETSILTDLDNTNRAIAEVLQQKLQDIGISSTIQSVEWAQFLEITGAGTHDIFITGWTSVTRDADYGLFPLFHSSNVGAGGNRAFYSNPVVDSLLEEARQERDEARRAELYVEIQEILVEDAPWVFLYIGEILIGTNGNVRNFRANPSGHHRFSEVALD